MKLPPRMVRTFCKDAKTAIHYTNAVQLPPRMAGFASIKNRPVLRPVFYGKDVLHGCKTSDLFTE